MTKVFRPGLRVARAAALVTFACSAAALADGTKGMSFPMPMAFVNDVEAALVKTIVGLRNKGLSSALDEIDRALERAPNFKLGYLIQGDLLMARAGRPDAFAARVAAVNSVAPLNDLKDEARVRLQRYLDAPPVEWLPAPVLQLAPNQAHALVVDTTRSRLFVYENDQGKPRYVTDFYISVGKNGVEKTREGDQKTPIGVYTIVGQKAKLPDFYGPGAFPISYPNEWDKRNGRNGHGIWLHGTPSETYSRPPRATDGCVVLTNEDLKRLGKYVDIARTPVVIGEGIQWREPRAWETDRASFMAAFAQWKADWESRDLERYFSHYSADFRTDGQDAASWKAHKRKVGGGKTWIKVGVKDLSLFAYPGPGDLMMVTFEQDYRSNNLSNRTIKRQYWAREGKGWRIVHESVLS